jgi:hypothetical protein
MPHNYFVPVPLIERIWANSSGSTDEECWLCHYAPASIEGYRRIRLPDQRRMLMHRVAWEMFNAEPIPEGMHVLHRCDNPPCFNPHHLFLGTDLDNFQDRLKKGRAPRRPDGPLISLITG